MAGESALCHDWMKSPAVRGSPFDQWSPSLRWNVHTRPSAEVSQDCAAAGMAFDVFSSIAVRPSKSARRMFWSV